MFVDDKLRYLKRIIKLSLKRMRFSTVTFVQDVIENENSFEPFHPSSITYMCTGNVVFQVKN